ncbi:MAG: TolC family protein [Bacteroidetes bacterium]|nr:MAG: TolC family protein [Bacteroidota bacterium]
MKLILNIFWFSLFFFIINIVAEAQSVTKTSTFTLKQCIIYAIEHNTDVQKAKLELDKSKYQTREIFTGGFIPQYNGSVRFDDYLDLATQLIPGEIFNQPGTTIPVKFGTKYNVTAGIEGTQLIFNGPLILNYKISKKAQQLNELNIVKTQEEIIYEVAKTYYNIQIINKQKDVTEANIINIDTLIKIARLQYKNGIINKIDLDRLAVNLVNLQTQLENIQLSKEQLTGLLKYYMGIPFGQQLIPADTIPENTMLINADSKDPGNSIELQLLEKQKEVSLLNVRQSKADYLPTLTFYQNYYYQAQRGKIDFFDRDKKWYPVSIIGLNLTIPLLSGFLTNKKVKQAKIQHMQLSLTEQNTKSYLAMQNDNIIKKIKVNIKAIETQRKNMQLAEEVYRITQQQYQKGITLLSDLLNAETSLREAQTNYLNALVQLKLAELNHLRNNGNILTLLK